MDGHLVAGPAAKEALAIILHDNERMLVARPRVGRQDKVGEGLGSERSRVTEAAHLTELQPRKKRIGIEDHSLLAVREVDRDEKPRPARADRKSVVEGNSV